MVRSGLLLLVLGALSSCGNKIGSVDAGPDQGTTLPCSSDAECPSNLPTCHPMAKICIGCIAGMDTCSTVGTASQIGTFVCDPPTHRCIPRAPDFGCETNSDCAGMTPVCYRPARTCVECLSTNDCGGDKPYCDSFFPNATGVTDGFLSFKCDDGCNACKGLVPVCQRDLGACCPLDGGACVRLAL